MRKQLLIDNDTFYKIVCNAFAQLSVVEQDGTAAHNLVVLANIYAALAEMYTRYSNFDSGDKINAYAIAQTIADELTFAEQEAYFNACFADTNVKVKVSNFVYLSA